jgi:rod shape-determining protein MreB and related proteins
MRRAIDRRFGRPQVMLCVPSGLTPLERDAVEEAARAAGARAAYLIEEPLAAAIGAGLSIEEPRANVVVDVGGGTSEVAVISLGGIVVSRSLRVGGYDFDETGATWIRANHGLAIGESSAEQVKLEIGSVTPDTTDNKWEVRGRDPATGLPREVVVTSEELRGALEGPVRDIVTAVRDALEETPPELASDLALSGILLAGGGALLRGFAERLESETGVPVRTADLPLDCVALGAGQALDEMELLERTAERTGGALTALRRPGR